MRWSELSVPFGPPGAGDIGVEGVIYDSRLAGPGQIFVAIRGVHRDGHDFVRAALAGGSPAAVVERRIEGVPGEPLVVVADSRIALAQLAAAIHGHPSRASP
ncbi:UDP-N-acetylmuramoylalanyl-D-glutamyl-2,6-diaminopimelate--D-alanyl-D-alanyl ligase [mine drainage metagenome]|uniref:UDP-N-acetylmuramoylalanyl-D-glutamyl-2, 6-diaminopimelate--D-alanyl-D-alanyl ligase n=1 Tax=mine drainage metagenome TaxID=410659 RepID=T0ZVZ5_9ZZZZ